MEEHPYNLRSGTARAKRRANRESYAGELKKKRKKRKISQAERLSLSELLIRSEDPNSNHDLIWREIDKEFEKLCEETDGQLEF